jgi:amino acid permease
VNAFNRIVLLILALLLLVVPVLLLLVFFGLIPADVINQYTGYRGAVQALGGFSASSLTTGGRTVIAVIGALVALIALLLLLRELTFGRRVSRSTVMDDTPGRETVITANAVKTLAESAAREVGAESPSVSLASDGNSYVVFTGIQVPSSDNYTELAARARENIRSVLGDQGVPVKDVEVTVRGTAL